MHPSTSEIVLAAEETNRDWARPGQDMDMDMDMVKERGNEEKRHDDQSRWKPVVWSGSGSQRSRPSALSHGENETGRGRSLNGTKTTTNTNKHST